MPLQTLTPQEIRDSFVNCSTSEAADLPLPPGVQ
ncbi:FBP domain-containing protein [Leifsonia xyli]|nr:FBP domain-containing protein [Leifsonia xyli]